MGILGSYLTLHVTQYSDSCNFRTKEVTALLNNRTTGLQLVCTSLLSFQPFHSFVKTVHVVKLFSLIYMDCMATLTRLDSLLSRISGSFPGYS